MLDQTHSTSFDSKHPSHPYSSQHKTVPEGNAKEYDSICNNEEQNQYIQPNNFSYELGNKYNHLNNKYLYLQRKTKIDSGFSRSISFPILH